jgi:hypothetical protein
MLAHDFKDIRPLEEGGRVCGIKMECEVDWVATLVLWEQKVASFLMSMLRKIGSKKMTRA